MDSTSCRTILETGKSRGSGVYVIDPSGNEPFDVYCDMEAAGGGWTLVAAQFESNPISQWPEPRQSDYDPNLASGRSFALINRDIPPHTQTAAGKALSATFVDYWDLAYQTGNIPVTRSQGLKTGTFYDIYRNASGYFSSHDPEAQTEKNVYRWNNTLTFDEVGGHGFNWAFSPQHPNQEYRSYALGGAHLPHSNIAYAWTVWVR